MAGLLKYVVNSRGAIPSYCFAEDSLVPENCYKVTSTEEKHEVPLVSFESTLPKYDSHCQQQPVRPPPGFHPLSEQRFPSNASRSFQNGSFKNPSTNASNTKSSVFGDVRTNPFLSDEQFIPSDVVKQLYMTVWNENKQLHTGVTEILYDLLEHSSLSLKNQIQLNKILKIIKKTLLNQKDGFTDMKIPTSVNFTSGMTSNDVDLTQKASYNLNNETVANQEPNVNTPSMSNPFAINIDDKPQCNTASSAYGLDSFSFKSNWSQSDEFSSRMQIPPSTATPTSSMFINYIPPVNTFFSKANQDGENISVMTPVPPAVPMNTNTLNNFSEFLNNMNNQFTSMLKDTNPFKFSMTDVSGSNEMQASETQTEQIVSNYDTDIASYLSTKNLQSNALKTETANIHARNNGFTSISNLGHVNESYTPRIVYESGPITYNIQKKQPDLETNANVKQNACSSNFDNIQNAQSLKLEQNSKKLASQVSQSANDIASLHNQHTVINNNIRDNFQNDENYVTRLSTYFMQGSQLTNSESIYRHQNSAPDNLQTVSSQSWNQFEIPDWANSKFQNSIPLLNHNEKTLSYQDWNYSVEGITFIFNFEHDGWILTNEFVEAFTKLKFLSFFTMVDTLNIKVTFKEILRSQYPLQFSQLDRYSLNVPRDSEKRILSIHLISLQTALALLHKLKIVSRDQIENAFKKNEFVAGSVLPILWVSTIKMNVMSETI
ncbi:hypothetical protein ALC62_02342 [Cyphomyrmex costatus]|uniref:Uncharacterized protein n=1 Tax=Cyphomyrmex costatus TaxID=456900 RepID=A0A195D2U6_9HYME|nr:hypothetical protein ALC62_02342 [Cyphomyrmex costatus]